LASQPVKHYSWGNAENSGIGFLLEQLLKCVRICFIYTGQFIVIDYLLTLFQISGQRAAKAKPE
jgi:hypothetical protein